MTKKRGRPSKTSFREDGWANILTGIGANNSRVNSTRYGSNFRLDKDTLTNIYLTDGIGRRVVNILVDDAMRTFIHCEKNLLDELQRLKTKQVIIEAATWARLYGGSAIVVFADDGQEMDRPLKIESVKKVVSIKAYDRYQIQWSPVDFIINYYDENFGEPEVYTIIPYNGLPFRVHRSRLHLFNGDRVPQQEYIRNNRWYASVLESVYEALRNYGQTMNASAEIVQDFIQVILGINGLTDMLRSGNDHLVTKRSNVIDLTRSVSNTIFLDSEQENYQKQASSVAGLAELWDRFSEAISATTGIPISKLLGRSPGGLNSSGKNDMDNWDNIVDAYRGDEIEPFINWIIDILKTQSIWVKDRPNSYDWSFPSLKISNENDIANNRLLAAKLDQIYIQSGCVDPEFIFKKRYSGGFYETDIFIEDDEFNNSVPFDNDLASIQDINDIKNQISAVEKEKEDIKERQDMLDKKNKIDLLANDLCLKMLERL